MPTRKEREVKKEVKWEMTLLFVLAILMFIGSIVIAGIAYKKRNEKIMQLSLVTLASGEILVLITFFKFFTD